MNQGRFSIEIFINFKICDILKKTELQFLLFEAC